MTGTETPDIAFVYITGSIFLVDSPVISRVKTMSIRKIVIKLENGIDQKKVREYLKYAPVPRASAP